jgi:hypothetical protein
MHRSLLPAAALTGALALGCADQPTPSEPADASQPSFRTEQNPQGPGAFIIRGQQGAVFGVDLDDGLSALVRRRRQALASKLSAGLADWLILEITCLHSSAGQSKANYRRKGGDHRGGLPQL